MQQTSDLPSVPCRWTGDLPSVPSRWTGDLPSVPSRWTGGLPSVPSRWTGGLPSVPSRWTGDLPSVPSRWTGACGTLGHPSPSHTAPTPWQPYPKTRWSLIRLMIIMYRSIVKRFIKTYILLKGWLWKDLSKLVLLIIFTPNFTIMAKMKPLHGECNWNLEPLSKCLSHIS